MEFSKDQFSCPVEAAVSDRREIQIPYPLASDRKTAPLHGAAAHDPQGDA